MTGVDSGGFRFVSHQRRGLVAVPGVAAAGTVAVASVLSDGSSTTPVTLQLASLGDVEGVDPSLVARQYPRPGGTDVETEFFPLVEFTLPELPWLMPAPSGPSGPLPWLCLVVVERRDGVTVTGSGPGLPDALHIASPARPSEELPDPAASALWAHAFAATAVRTEGTADPFETTPGVPLGGCRLVAPRRLAPNTSYVACLVPTFAASALRGLGRSDQEVAAALAAPQPAFAWHPSDTSVDLPTYLHWEFSCGDGGDFETLVRQLKEVPVPQDFGTRPLDLGLAGPGMPDVSTTGTVFRGALIAPGIAPAAPWPDPADADQAQVDAAITGEIHAAAQLTAAAADRVDDPADNQVPARPAVGPMLYAGAAAGRTDVGTGAPATDWFDQLNRDPRSRAVAGIATRVLRRDVEAVMAEAWDQVGEVEAANAALRRLQMSRAVSVSLHARHLSALDPGRLVSAARPVLPRVAVPPAATAGTATLHALAAIAASPLPAGATWRGLTVALRPGTRLGDAAAGRAGEPGTSGRLIGSLVAGLTEPKVVPDGTVGIAAPSVVFGAQATALLTEQVRAAASAAQTPLPAADADEATVVAALDAAAATASRQIIGAATRLSALTPAAVTARALPSTAVFAQNGGVLVRPAVLRGAASASDVTVQAAGHVVVTAGTAAPAPAPAGRVPIGRTTPTPTAPALMGPVVTGPVVSGPVVTGPVRTGPAAQPPVVIQLNHTDPRLVVMQSAYAAAVGRFVGAGQASVLPAAGGLDLAAARTSLLANLHPASTIPVLARARVPALELIRLQSAAPVDPVAPVMAGPVFADAAYTALVQASHDAFVPGLDAIPQDSVTLVETNPTFIAAYLAGINAALGHELLWRGYPTDERGTYWHSFWGDGPEIGPLHRCHGGLADNVLEGSQPLLVLILRGRLLRRYPDSDIYAVLASTDAALPELDGGVPITRPIFRDFVDPDITLVGFPLTYEQVTGTAGGTGYWFVVAEHPGQPRFGLVDADPAVVHPPLPTWNELSWADLGTTAAAATYLPSAASPIAPAGTTRHWAASAADMTAITYQPAVRVAIRAKDLLGRTS
jgi:hypothetical protein